MANDAITLMAHLMRRAGFGAPYAELEVPQRLGALHVVTGTR